MRASVKHHVYIDADKWFTDTISQKRIRVFYSVKDIKMRTLTLLNWLCDEPSQVHIRMDGDEDAIFSLNQAYRGRSKSTDVLSFPSAAEDRMAAHQEKAPYPLGNILLCVPVCFRQCQRRPDRLAKELEKMIIHGLVHLKGFDHERGSEAESVMKTLERSLAKNLISIQGEPDWLSLEAR